MDKFPIVCLFFTWLPIPLIFFWGFQAFIPIFIFQISMILLNHFYFKSKIDNLNRRMINNLFELAKKQDRLLKRKDELIGELSAKKKKRGKKDDN